MAELTLVLETANGTFVRRIPEVSPLPAVEEQGYEAEDASRSAASTFGMPDFVFLSKQQRNGSGKPAGMEKVRAMFAQNAP
jgi:hypothetical protein